MKFGGEQISNLKMKVFNGKLTSFDDTFDTFFLDMLAFFSNTGFSQYTLIGTEELLMLFESSLFFFFNRVHKNLSFGAKMT